MKVQNSSSSISEADVSAGLEYITESKEVGSNASKAMELPMRARASGKENKLPSLGPLYGLPASYATTEGGLTHLKIIIIMIIINHLG